MTNKSAIVIIKAMITTHKSLEAQGINSDVPFDEESIEALNVAIDSLKKPNIHGHWIKDNGYGLPYRCSICGSGGLKFWNFCRDCGADMREPPRGEMCVNCTNNGLIDTVCLYCTNHNKYEPKGEKGTE